MKKFIAFAYLPLTILATADAKAQWAVIDVANVQQSINQVAAWKKQYEQMAQQQQQLKAQQVSMTGSRGLGMIANDPRLRGIVPDTAAQTYDAIQANGGGSMTSAAQAIRAATRVYDCDNRTGRDRITCQAFLSNNAQTQAFQQNAMTGLAQRTRQIQTLQAQINATNDPKSIAELQARLQVEAAQVNNDTNRLMMMKAMSESSDRAAQQALKEQELRNLALRSDGTDTFVYKPYARK